MTAYAAATLASSLGAAALLFVTCWTGLNLYQGPYQAGMTDALPLEQHPTATSRQSLLRAVATILVFGLGGWLNDLDRRLPFALIFTLVGIGLAWTHLRGPPACSPEPAAKRLADLAPTPLPRVLPLRHALTILTPWGLRAALRDAPWSWDWGPCCRPSPWGMGITRLEQAYGIFTSLAQLLSLQLVGPLIEWSGSYRAILPLALATTLAALACVRRVPIP